MMRFRLSARFPGGSVLIGGYSAVPPGLHGVHAQDAQGHPILPATALRGALRETLESLLRGAGEGACRGGDGHGPSQSETSPTPIPCQLGSSSGQRCKACQLFGTQRGRLDPDERSFSALVLGEARLPDGREPQWTIRPGVAIARKRRSAEDKRLFMRRVPLLDDTPFIASGRLLDERLKPLLEAAVAHTTHLGAGRSRGLARVELSLQWLENEAQSLPSFPAEGDVRLRVTLESPAVLGDPVVIGNYRGCRSEIPGTALRGAIGFALAEIVADTSDQAYQALLSESGAQFGFLYPVGAAPQALAGPVPLTAVACKYAGDKHGVADTLFDRLAFESVNHPADAMRVQQTRMETCFCGSALRSWAGFRGPAAHPSLRTVNRVSMDRARGSARDQMLFTEEMIELGSIFEGTIRDIPAEGRQRLKEALVQPLSVGRGRSAGYGRVRVDVAAPLPLESVLARGEQFERALAQRLRSAGLSTDHVNRLVPITLLTPLIVADNPADDDGAKSLCNALSATKCVLRARRFTREGGWNQRTGEMQGVMATAAGSIFVLELGRDWREILAVLQDLERLGTGQRRCQGFGQILCFDPFFLSRPQKRQTMTAPDPLRSKRKDLVLAAERLIQKAFAPNRHPQLRLKKTQLNSLVSICGEASCRQEIENYIRYQAGRGSDKTGWDLDLAKECIGAVEPILTGITDEEGLEAWRLFAVYLTRAFTYEYARTH